MKRWLLVTAGVLGLLAVALGAFGAHGLKSSLAGLPDAEQRMSWWQTASHYQAWHAAALALPVAICEKSPTAARVTQVAFVAGVLLFSGSLYVMALTGVRKLGAITPLGGVSFLVGWAAIIAGAYAGDD